MFASIWRKCRFSLTAATLRSAGHILPNRADGRQVRWHLLFVSRQSGGPLCLLRLGIFCWTPSTPTVQAPASFKMCIKSTQRKQYSEMMMPVC